MRTALYYQEEDTGNNVELSGKYDAEYGQAEYLADQMLFINVFGFECGVSTVGYAPFFFTMTTYVHNINLNIQLFYIILCSFWLPRHEILEFFKNATSVAFHLNFTKGRIILSLLPQVQNILSSSIEC